MELPIRDAKARFAEAATMAARPASGMDFEKAAAVRRELGLDSLDVTMTRDFDDPAFSNQVLGLSD